MRAGIAYHECSRVRVHVLLLCTPLCSLASLRRLIGYKADVNGVDAEGHSVLFYAAVGGNVDCARALINAGASLTPLADNTGARVCAAR